MSNPYQTPKSDLTNTDNTNSQESGLAKRSSRLLAAIIDGIIGMLIALPFWFISGIWESIRSGVALSFSYTIAAGVYGFLGFTLIHFYFLNKNGQTIGKKFLNIKIVNLDDQLTGAMPLILKRYLPVSVISLIPILGSLLVLVDILFIYRNDKRCIHDLIAGTKVVACY
jgi:uncharacterized RDD family membrane protein YckC